MAKRVMAPAEKSIKDSENRRSLLPAKPVSHLLRRSPSADPNQSIIESSGPNKRTSHACDRCRQLKAKCSGGSSCNKCVQDRETCIYGDRKRERNKKDLAESLHQNDLLAAENRRLVDTLRRLCSDPRLNSNEHTSVTQVLSEYSSADRMALEGMRPRDNSVHRFYTQQPALGEIAGTLWMTEIGTPGTISGMSTMANTNIDTRTPGYDGKMTELSWLSKLPENFYRPPSGSLDAFQNGLDNPVLTSAEIDYNMNSADELPNMGDRSHRSHG